MADERTEIHAEAEAARAGSTPNIVRWVLVISLAAAIILLSLIWITGAATRGPGTQTVEYDEQVPPSTVPDDGPVASNTTAIPSIENETKPAPSPTPNTGN